MNGSYSITKRIKISLLVLSVLHLATPLFSQEQSSVELDANKDNRALFPQPSERFYNVRMKLSSLGVGGIILKDEYLSPLQYGGFTVSYTNETSQLRYRPLSHGVPFTQRLLGNIPREASNTWLSQRHFIVVLGQSKNPAGNATISHLQARLSGSRQYNIYQGEWGRVYLGPGYTLGAGGLYSSRNGNNPATLKLDGSLSLMASYSYRLPWIKFPALIRVSSRTDLIGVQWGQEYGESYYELYYLTEAWHKRFALTYLGKSLGQEFRLNIDLPIWDRVVYNIGYRYQHRTWTHSGLYNQMSEHSISLGITRYLRPMGGRKWQHEEQKHLPF